MITVHNSKLIPGLDWQKYVAIPAHSFSGLKNQGKEIVPTANMELGTRVDNYSFEPHLYDGKDYKTVRACAGALRSVLGNLRPQVQLAVTATFEHNGLYLPVKGRIDMRVPGLIIDLKVSKLDQIAAINHFRYDWQLGGYATMTGDVKALLISINPINYKASILSVPYKLDWWEHMITQHGKKINHNQIFKS